mmetsp:Transcript_803/g.1997  ORF Transcript_803/g.1997 Transcript_803/m.1997 type:complete len:354 (-) Transcript_803:274-1335(-)|eukprot:CAMPEP_0172369758 /NCGR_PEP_ID=MMETSP1060-20121228/34312_1 /TAXON_ID=37318 /ORGANISM="Pseudo-nitzschia pungens, Strain cf. cingulata" /LENGTH=353 /DNA_ID=CAMNT_0013094797 /DNA_START=92 /DNA_END=1153 /DNA_ORIENTATION=-
MTEIESNVTSVSWSSFILGTVSVVVWRSLQLISGVGIAALVGLYFKQDSLLYFPEIGGMPRNTSHNPRGYRSPAESGLNFEDLRITCDDGVSIHAWLIFGKNNNVSDSIPTIIFFHGNAGNMGFRLPNAMKMLRRLNANVLMVDYRGYGRSDQVAPSESGLRLDGQAVLNFAQNHPKIDPTNIFLFGRSLGGAVTFATAKYAQENSNGRGANNIHPLKGIIVENTFTSIPDMVDALMPFVAKFKRLILAIGWHSVSIVPTLTCPVLYLAGSMDEIVPHSQMLKLHRSTTMSILNRLHVIQRGTHNESWVQGGGMYWEAIKSFVAGAISVGNSHGHIHDTVVSGVVEDAGKKEL